MRTVEKKIIIASFLGVGIEVMLMELAAITDTGRQRKNNEDCYFTYNNDRLVGGMVADGMGGHNSGEVASKMACDLIKQYIITNYNPQMDYMQMAELMRMAFVKTNREIYNASQKGVNKGMGTTATLALVYDSHLLIAHVGDSRCYRIDSEITQLTNDHSYVGALLRNGQISEHEAESHPNRNLITRALGAEDNIKVDMDIKRFGNETILVCSDGLSNMLSESQIKDIICEKISLNAALQKLAELANRKGGSDNITAVAFRKLKGEAER